MVCLHINVGREFKLRGTLMFRVGFLLPWLVGKRTPKEVGADILLLAFVRINVLTCLDKKCQSFQITGCHAGRDVQTLSFGLMSA